MDSEVKASHTDPEVAIVILHYEGFEGLCKCIDSVLLSRYSNLRVFLVDNGSVDGSVGRAEERYRDRINLLKLQGNLGFVRGYNVALKQIFSDYVVLLNDDTIVEPDWLNALVSVAESDGKIGACQPKLRWLSHPSYFEYNGACGGMLDSCAVPFTRGRLFDRAEQDLGQYDTSVDVFWASGAAMFLRRDALVEADFLDEMFYAHMEEIDLSWRLRLRGYRVVSVPSSVVYHLGGGTSLGSKSFLKHRNNLLMMVKNYSATSLLKYLPLRFLLDMASVLYLSIRRRVGLDTDPIRAYYWLLVNMRKVVRRRGEVQSRRLLSDKAIIRNMARPNVALQYFFLKRVRFSELTGLPLSMRSYLRNVSPELAGKTATMTLETIF